MEKNKIKFAKIEHFRVDIFDKSSHVIWLSETIRMMYLGDCIIHYATLFILKEKIEKSPLEGVVYSVNFTPI